MTIDEKIILVKALVGDIPEATDALVGVYLSDAQATILGRLYRAYGSYPEGTEVPTFYESLQCRLAARRFLKRGAEGEIIHAENGVSRQYGTTSDEDLLREVIPFAKVGG